MIEQAFESDNFITDDECKRLIEYQKTYRSPDRIMKGSFPDSFVREYCFDKSIESLMRFIHVKVCYFMQKYYNEKLYLEFSNLVYWHPGTELSVHADNFNIHDLSTLNNNRYRYRDYSFILYLNSEFKGGELWFPTHDDYKIKPKTGKIVFFPGGSGYMHGVTKVTSGARYTLAGWFTKEKSKGILYIKEEELNYFKNYRGPKFNSFGMSINQQ